MSARRWPRLSELHTIVFDFDGVFTDNAVYLFEDGREAVRCDRRDGLGIELLRRFRDRENPGLELLVLSKEINAVVGQRARKLKLDCVQATTDKLAALIERLRGRIPDDDPLRGLLYFGNDLNDLPVMRRCGFSVAPADAHVLVRECATVVLPEAGGCGFVRAGIELLLGFEQRSTDELSALFTAEGILP